MFRSFSWSFNKSHLQEDSSYKKSTLEIYHLASKIAPSRAFPTDLKGRTSQPVRTYMTRASCRKSHPHWEIHRAFGSSWLNLILIQVLEDQGHILRRNFSISKRDTAKNTRGPTWILIQRGSMHWTSHAARRTLLKLARADSRIKAEWYERNSILRLKRCHQEETIS